MLLLRLSICVVLYKSQATSRRFAREITDSLAVCDEWELLFYDNSPTDDLRDLAGFGHYQHDPSNRGFSYANNQLILKAQFENILLVNPDVFGFDGGFWVRLLADAIGRPEVRFIKLLNEDGSHQDCVGEVVSLSRLARPRTDYAAISDVRTVGMGIMAFMLATRDIFARVGLLDSDYPLYAEDMDWCHRAGKVGIPVVYDPRLVLTHLGGASASDRWSRRQSLRRKYTAERIFIDKHARGPRWALLHALNRLKIWAKA